METPPPVHPVTPTPAPEAAYPFVPNHAEVVAAAANATNAANAEATANAERAGRMSRIAKGIGNVAVKHVMPAVARGFKRAGRNLSAIASSTVETVGNMVEGGARLAGRTARGIGSVAYGGYARVQTGLGMFQAGLGARPNTPKAETLPPLWGVPPPPARANRHGLRESFGRAARTGGFMGAVAIGAVLAARHGFNFGGGGSGRHIATEALPSIGSGNTHGLHISGDSLPSSSHGDVSPMAHSSIGGNHAGNTVAGTLAATAGAGGVYAGYRGLRSHRRNRRANAHYEHRMEERHYTAQDRAEAGVQHFQDVRIRHRTGPRLGDQNVASGHADELVNGTPVNIHPYSDGAGSKPRSGKRAIPGVYDPRHRAGRKILDDGDETNRNHPLGGH